MTFNGHRVDAASYWAVSGGGTITMNNPADTLVLHTPNAGVTLFQGPSETGLMTAGTVIDRAANFQVTGLGFDQTGGSGTFVVDSTVFQSLTWTSPTYGHGAQQRDHEELRVEAVWGQQRCTSAATFLFDVSMATSGGALGSINLYLNSLTDNSTIANGAFNGSTVLHFTGNVTNLPPMSCA